MTSSADGGVAADGGQPATQPEPSARSRDRVAVRRALVAGAAVAAPVALLLAVGLPGGQGLAVALLLGLGAGGLVAALWSLAALALDVLADHRPGRRRLVWTGALVVSAVLLTLLGLGGART